MTLVWQPSIERINNARLTDFVSFLNRRGSYTRTEVPVDYASLHTWSVENREEFWLCIAEYFGVRANDLIAQGHSGGSDVVSQGGSIGIDRMAPPTIAEGPRWFTGARLNFAENILKHRSTARAIVSRNEKGIVQELSFEELYQRVAQLAASLRGMGVEVGDRVAGFMPNIAETIIAMLATTSIGAVWSSCSPDFGVQGIFDRFSQIRPKVLFAADGYLYGGKEIDCVERVAQIVERIPSIEHVVVVPYRNRDLSGLPHNAVLFDKALATGVNEIEFEQLPFDHPVYIMYSSGTTGLPKCMVHGAGGTILQHSKELGLHTDLKEGDTMFYYTTCGWMMWNWMVSSLSLGAAVVLFDGAPLSPKFSTLWDIVAAESVTHFGTSAKYLAVSEKNEIVPSKTHNISSLRAVLSTGSPLADHSYDYVYSLVKSDLHLASISGGTDIISCFALGNPTAPVFRGELQARGLGMAVEIYGDSGQSVRQTAGELVCTKAFPSMPVSFWDDPEGKKYHDAYFDTYENVWRHGDWAEITENDGLIIYGRSDATLNPSGVRIGTAEIYRQVEQLPEVLESVAVGKEVGEGAHGDVQIVLFVRLREGLILDVPLKDRIKAQIRANTSPLHVPKLIVQVADIPRTISGKITEIAVREVIHGRPVKNIDALANPQSLELFRNIPQLR